jgi:Ni,Fe-hydrogenase III component G
MNEIATKPLPLEELAARLGAAQSWTESAGVLWLTIAPAQIRPLAQAMNEAGARFVTITAAELDEGLQLDYHWDLAGQLLGFRILTENKSIESIYDLCPALDWIEREVHDAYAVAFTGREMEPLLLRKGDQPGVQLQKEAK